MNCKNCNEAVNGNFCTYCGQSTKVDKINFTNFLSDLSGSIFQVDKGFFYSLRELLIRPGYSIREYLEGKRKNHFKPIAYAFTLSAIYFLLSQLVESGTFLNDAIQGYSSGSQVESEHLEILNWFAKNYAYTMLMLLPLYALVSYVTFLGSKFNYLEHFVLNAYITGQQAAFYSLSILLSLVVGSHDFWASVMFFISIFYTIFVFSQFFSEESRLSIILRSILTYVLYLILFVVTIMVIFLVFKTFSLKILTFNNL